MRLILDSFFLSFGVFSRMIFPVLAIVILSSVVWGLLNLISGGYAGFISGTVTATFISLFGIRVALSLLGDNHRTAYETLVLYSVLYGLFLLIAKGAVLMLSDVVAVAYAEWKFDGGITIRNFVNAERSLQVAFSLHAMSAKAIVSMVFYTTVFVVMAVPLASAARGVGHGTMSVGFFNGVARSFIPLFLIFSVSFFLQFFFDLFTFLFAIVPLFLSIFSIVIFQSVPDIDLDVLLRGLAASAGLLWLHSVIWAASALAFVKYDGASKPSRGSAPSQVETNTDMRALRKARE